MSNNEIRAESMIISTEEISDKVLPYNGEHERTETDKMYDNENKSYTIISLDKTTSHTLQVQMNCQSEENTDTVCTVCGIECSSNENLVAHMRIHSGIKLYKYNVCGKSYKCDVCERCFCQEYNLKIHMRIHTGDKPFQCDVCDIEFDKSKDLQHHRRTHNCHDCDKPHKCKACGKEFRTPLNLERHRKNTCSKSYRYDKFDEEILQNKNLGTHTLDKPFKCGLCINRSFTSSNNLKGHLLTHTKGISPYICGTCDKRFYESTELERHMSIHACEIMIISTDEISDKVLPFNGEKERTETDKVSDNKNKSYTIIYLDKTTGHTLQVQMNCQSGENIDTVCTVCGIECSSNENLVAHMRTHSGIKLYKYNVRGKSYKCDVCDRGFCHEYSLKRHMRIHTGDKPFQCDVCDIKFKD